MTCNKIKFVLWQFLLPAVVTCAAVMLFALTFMWVERVVHVHDRAMAGERCLVEHPSMEHAP